LFRFQIFKKRKLPAGNGSRGGFAGLAAIIDVEISIS
jgi:hypothetical protein